MRILAIDPGAKGGNTGIFLGGYDKLTPLWVEKSLAIEGGSASFAKWCKSEHMIHDADDVICEKFISRGNAADLTPIRIEGMLEFIRPDAIFQSSAAALANPLLRHCDLSKWIGSDKSHHKDISSALKHALAFLISNGHSPTIESIVATISKTP